MKQPVWISRTKGTPRAEFVTFSAGRDVVSIPEADAVLVPYDLWTNRAYAIGLQKIGVYSQSECRKILKAFNRLESEWQAGTWRLDPNLEDVHINLESWLSGQCGEDLGGRIHSGRSRNDQVATDMKLYTRDVILDFIDECLGLVFVLLTHGAEQGGTVMPGYTHHRKATITSWGHWCVAYAQGVLRDTQRFADLFQRVNICPLGAAASYGTTWPLDRPLLSDLLGFDSVQENTLDAVASRGEAEAETAYCAACLLKRLACLSQDLILFSTEEFGFLSLPADFTTGSSIMPQKRNPDFAEAIKGKAHVVNGMAQALLSIDGSNLSGYNKDVQWSKYLFMDAVREASGAARILTSVFGGITVHKRIMEEAARTGFLNAVDIADYLARSRRLPFRKTYQLLSDAVGASSTRQFLRGELNRILKNGQVEPLTEEEFNRLNDPRLCLSAREHVGSPSPMQVKEQVRNLKRKATALQRWAETRRQAIQSARKRCYTL